MTADTAVTLMLEHDIMPNPLISVEARPDIIRLLKWMHQVGFEEAQLVQRSQRPVLKFSKNGEYLETYRSLTAAARRHRICHQGISCAISGKQKTAAGFVWRYAEVG